MSPKFLIPQIKLSQNQFPQNTRKCITWFWGPNMNSPEFFGNRQLEIGDSKWIPRISKTLQKHLKWIPRKPERWIWGPQNEFPGIPRKSITWCWGPQIHSLEFPRNWNLKSGSPKLWYARFGDRKWGQNMFEDHPIHGRQWEWTRKSYHQIQLAQRPDMCCSSDFPPECRTAECPVLRSTAEAACACAQPVLAHAREFLESTIEQPDSSI